MRKYFILFFSLCAISAPASSIEGSWAMNCRSTGTASYESEYIQVSANHSEVYYATFTDASCTQMVYQLHVAGNFREEGPSAVVSGAIQYQATNDIYSLTPHSEEFVSEMNGVAFCGYSDWKLGEPKNLLGQVCGKQKMPTAGSPYYNLFGFGRGAVLYFGKDTEELDGSSPEKRPIELDRDRAFVSTEF